MPEPNLSQFHPAYINSLGLILTLSSLPTSGLFLCGFRLKIPYTFYVPYIILDSVTLITILSGQI